MFQLFLTRRAILLFLTAICSATELPPRQSAASAVIQNSDPAWSPDGSRITRILIFYLTTENPSCYHEWCDRFSSHVRAPKAR